MRQMSLPYLVRPPAFAHAGKAMARPDGINVVVRCDADGLLLAFRLNVILSAAAALVMPTIDMLLRASFLPNGSSPRDRSLCWYHIAL